jgi:2,4-dienoyl-CoA reductase (NADPH2)
LAPAGQRFPLLGQPLHLGGLTLRNRIVMGSMHTGLEELDDGFERLSAFYVERARGGAALIITGGFGIDDMALGHPGAAKQASLQRADQLEPHRKLCEAVHQEGALIALQALHIGRNDYATGGVAPSSIASPLGSKPPRELSEPEILHLIGCYANTAALAAQAGYDGVELMGAEGYLINQFLAPRSNQRSDRWGGSASARRRFALELVKAVRAALPRQLLLFRISLIDLVEGGCSWDEVVELALALQLGGVDLLNSGAGWHESRVPTVASLVPQAPFAHLTWRLKQVLKIPVIASNRIAMPETAEALLAGGQADLVALARPLLADPDWAVKAISSRSDEINTCIACNQACLDRVFLQQPVTCLVNPRAGIETLRPLRPASIKRRLAVVGGGPAGLAFATTAALRGHQVTLFEAGPALGGQFLLALQIPGKEDYGQTLRYYQRQLVIHGGQVHLNQAPSAEQLQGFEQIVLATGVRARELALPGLPGFPGLQGDPRVLGYAQALARGRQSMGRNIAIIGAGGIGFDIAEWLSDPGLPPTLASYQADWGIDAEFRQRGGLCAPHVAPSERQIWLLQRKPGRPGQDLAPSTGWIRRNLLKRRNVQMLGGVDYLGLDQQGLHLRMDGLTQCLAIDQLIICAGQESERGLLPELQRLGLPTEVIGGADSADQLDAHRAIEQATLLALEV